MVFSTLPKTCTVEIIKSEESSVPDLCDHGTRWHQARLTFELLMFVSTKLCHTMATGLVAPQIQLSGGAAYTGCLPMHAKSCSTPSSSAVSWQLLTLIETTVCESTLRSVLQWKGKSGLPADNYPLTMYQLGKSACLCQPQTRCWVIRTARL